MNLSHPIFLAAHKKDNDNKHHTSNLNNAQKLNLIKVVFRILIKISNFLIN
ncbi:anthranilate synthase [Helicobacter pylori]|uniref:anthranilate synthase n=1 Tax=Helicobacter pylori TaxID=210 RepID=UPI001F0B975E|nr:anthranilate synthase [Helicobacter pylori]MDU9771965.1 anthranilate synthase [Helicobacter pylori]MDU9775193.1 anthranilate synthase [Helicobacter pylori]